MLILLDYLVILHVYNIFFSEVRYFKFLLLMFDRSLRHVTN